MFLVEMMIALVVASLLAVALVQSYAAVSAFGGKGQGELMAATIAQQVIDSARDTQFNNLLAEAGVHNLPINDGDSAYDPIFPRALMLSNSIGTTNLYCPDDGTIWSGQSWANSTNRNRMHGACVEQITEVSTTQINVEVWVIWNETGSACPVASGQAPPTVPKGCRQFHMQTIITQNGIHS
jgi:type II secretory pathway pseudopilin PulG